METQPSSLPFFPLDDLGPFFATYTSPFIFKSDASGFLTSTLATAVVVIVGHNIISSFKNSTPLRFALTILFLVNIALFIGGQTAALTFTAVSDACEHRNVLLTFADQFARVSSFIIGLNVIARLHSQLPKYALYGWAVVRLGTCSLLIRVNPDR